MLCVCVCAHARARTPQIKIVCSQSAGSGHFRRAGAHNAHNAPLLPVVGRFQSGRRQQIARRWRRCNILSDMSARARRKQTVDAVECARRLRRSSSVLRLLTRARATSTSTAGGRVARGRLFETQL